jgi:Arc/MetJ-type ribon-helix-helix transcriptional regulator
MPTKHPRVSVTVTPPLQEARERLRRRGVNASVAELALAGARELLAQTEARDADERQRQELRKRLTSRLRTGAALDDDALREVREHGWTRV